MYVDHDGATTLGNNSESAGAGTQLHQLKHVIAVAVAAVASTVVVSVSLGFNFENIIVDVEERHGLADGNASTIALLLLIRPFQGGTTIATTTLDVFGWTFRGKCDGHFTTVTRDGRSSGRTSSSCRRRHC